MSSTQKQREQSFVKRHLGTGDEQSASSETPAGHAELSGEGTTQEAVGDEVECSLTELVDASDGGENEKAGVNIGNQV